MWIIFFLGYVWAYELRITEVLVDGSDEFVEITNVGDNDFQWTFTLVGVKTSPLTLSNISIPSWTLLLLGDNLSMLSSDTITPKKTGLWLNLWDTSEVNIELIIDNEIVDQFSVSQTDVKKYDNTSTTFQRLRDGSERIILPTSLEMVRWSTVIANPWVVYYADGTIFLPLIDEIDDSDDKDSETSETCPISPFVIDEVYNGDEYTHYIELLFTQDWEWWLLLSGDILASSVEVSNQFWEKNMRYLITSSVSWLLHDDNIIVLPDLSVSTGQLLISSLDNGEGLSSSYVLNVGWSWYKEGMIDCDTFLTTAWIPSPWFDHVFLPYMGVISLPSWPYCPVDDDPDTGTGDNGQWSWTFDWLSWVDLRLSLIDYDPPWSDTNTERIGLTLLSGESISLSGWSVKYDSKTYKFQSGTVVFGTEYIRTANFQMVNSRPVCVNLYYLDTLVDTACYDPTTNPSPYLPLAEPAPSVDYANLQFDIVSLVYDPPGDDTNNETITIRFDWWADEVVLDELRLRVGTKTKRIYGTILSWQTLTLVGNFQMPNTTATCVALTYEDIVYDEYCYDPKATTTPKESAVTIDYSAYDIHIHSLVYDPPWSDTDNEIVVLDTPKDLMLDLSTFYIQFDDKKYYLKGISKRGGLVTLQDNYQMPNSKATCVELKQWNYVFDTYCYDPAIDKLWSGQNLTGDFSELFSGVMITIDNLVYDPPWSDTNAEVVTLTVSEPIMLPKPLYLSFDNKKKKLSDTLSLSGTMSFVWNYQMPNSKATCVQLLYGSQVLDEYCYDPSQKEMLSGQVDMSLWQWLQIARVLPNPKWKDIAKENELIALLRSGQSGQVIDKSVKLKINTTNIPLSGKILSVWENIFPAGKVLSNSPSCLYLYVGDVEIDRLCYPQAQEDTRYYHPRLWLWASTIPSSLLDALDFQHGSLSKLLLKKVEKKICLTYEGVQIRCMNAGETATSKKNRALLTLQNAYLSQISTLYYNNTLHPTTLRQRLQSYTTLSKRIKNNQLSSFFVYGAQVKPTELERYVELVSQQTPDDYMLDQFGRSLFWHDKMDEYYKKVYQ